MLTLEVRKREPKEKPSILREEGKIPAVFYGKKEKSTSVSVSESEFLKVWKKAGESTVVVLKGAGEDKEALIKDIDKDPVTERVRHADFYVFEKGQKIKVKIPLEFTGESPAVKTGGVLVKVIHELEVEAAPKDLPHAISVDITALENFQSQILAKHLKLPSGVILSVGPDEVVASVYEPKEEVEEVAAPIDFSTIEVEKKGKEAKEGEVESGAESPKAETPAKDAKKESK